MELILKTILVNEEFKDEKENGNASLSGGFPGALRHVGKAHLLENGKIFLEGFDRSINKVIYIDIEKQEQALNKYYNQDKVKFFKETLDSIREKLQK